MAKGVIYQTEFNKSLITKYFGERKTSTVINNGADLEVINNIQPLKSEVFEKYDKIWCSASKWRPHKRLNDNVQYFLEHSGPNDLMLVAGDIAKLDVIKDQKIKYLGNFSEFNIFNFCSPANLDFLISVLRS